MQNNDFYSKNYPAGEHIRSDSSRSEYDFSTNHGSHANYQSMQNIKKNRFSIIESIGNALKIVSIAIICVIVVLGTLAKITHGKALFLDRVEGEIIEREFIFHHYTFSEGTSKSKVKIAYTYNSKKYTMTVKCKATKTVGDNVYVYVNMLDPSKALYYDPLSTSFVLVPAIILLFVVCYQKFSRNSLTLPSSRSWR